MIFWLTYFYVLGGVISAVVIGYSVYAYPQKMKIMNIVWILTGLWASFFSLWAYYKFGINKPKGKKDKDSVKGKKDNKDSLMSAMDEMRGAESKDTMPGNPPAENQDSLMSAMDEMKNEESKDTMPGMDMSAEDDMSKMNMSDVSDTGKENDKKGMDMSGGDDKMMMNMQGMSASRDNETTEKPTFEMKGMDMSDKKDMDMSGMKGMDMSGKKGMNMSGMDMGSNRPFWQKTTLSALHCGAGCTLADIICETAGWLWFRHIPGWTIWWQWGLDYFCALIIGVLFQYAAIHPMMKTMPVGQTLIKALKIDFFSLTSWQLGMYISSYFIFFIYPHKIYYADTVIFWFIMQITMSVGFFLAYPTNYILIKKGIKPGM